MKHHKNISNFECQQPNFKRTNQFKYLESILSKKHVIDIEITKIS